MKNFQDFAKEIGSNLQILDNYITFSDAYYQTFYIKKKRGKPRQIDCPSQEIKSIQRWLLNKYFNSIEVSSRANGFIKKRGIKRNAQFHLNNKYLLAIDIKDFFLSIPQSKVFNALNKTFEDKTLALKLAKLCTYKRRLPQGAPTSPVISNIVFKEVDDEITNYCNAKLITYSRYADDLVFSSDNKNILVDLLPIITTVLFNNGYKINDKKTKFLSGKGAMRITGININEGRLTISSTIKRQIRSDIYKFIVKKDPTIKPQSIMGYLSYFKDIEPDHYAKVKEYIKKLKSKKKK